ncbi:MAG TPA: ATP-dependent DNA helicase, partial [Clostridia bacterium]|nr:ATP-dependent DNA helicase [Clostridia bacterium]
TVSVLFPAIKVLGEGKLERIFYLTARTVGRTVAEKACADLRRSGLRLRSLTLTAKEKICVQDGQPCDPQTCPLAKGYYDRRMPAMREALACEALTRTELEEIGRRHQVCPFELGLDVSMWVDAVICDYNYAFDPKVYLRRHFGERTGDYVFLVDEAHNLVDRAREMFSARLGSQEVQEVRRAIKTGVPRCARALSKLNTAMRAVCGQGAQEEIPEPSETLELDLFKKQESAAPTESVSIRGEFRVSREIPGELLERVEAALKEAETWLARNEPAEYRESLLGLYFNLLSFRRTAELYDEHYVCLAGQFNRASEIRLFCLDPSALLQEALQRGKAAVLFSATLTPLEYYRDLLGGTQQDPAMRLASPFPPENLAVLVQDRIRTEFKARQASMQQVVQAVATVVASRPGNYMVYGPSYDYLSKVRESFDSLHLPGVRILAQQPEMSEADRDRFLATFAEEHEETLVGFAVMGGIFGEGIDLLGDCLIGAVILGVGLPQLCVERDLIRDYFQAKLGTGFDYAYTFPGMNRVLQAIGRVIRSETDRGVVLLLDARFGQGRYRNLFPAWWRPETVRSESELEQALERFWRSVP